MPDEKVTPEFLERLKAHLRANATLVNMFCFSGVETSCGTAYCIAGHAVLVAGRKITTKGRVYRTGKRISQWAVGFFGFSSELGEDAPLFYPNRWPENIARRYALSVTDEDKAEACCAAIDHFFPPQEVAA